jgi:hypothetical protein
MEIMKQYEAQYEQVKLLIDKHGGRAYRVANSKIILSAKR